MSQIYLNYNKITDGGIQAVAEYADKFKLFNYIVLDALTSLEKYKRPKSNRYQSGKYGIYLYNT